MFNQKVECKYCHRTEGVKRHGTGHSGYQRYRCLLCKRTFQSKYVYIIYKEKTQEEIVMRYLAGESAYEISQNMKANVSTVKRCLSKAQLETSS